MLVMSECPWQPIRREVTKRRLARAAKSIEKQRQKLPLFADEVTMTPEEKIERDDENSMEWKLKMRRCWFESLAEVIRIWKAIPKEYRRSVEQAWSKSAVP